MPPHRACESLAGVPFDPMFICILNIKRGRYSSAVCICERARDPDDRVSGRRRFDQDSRESGIRGYARARSVYCV